MEPSEEIVSTMRSAGCSARSIARRTSGMRLAPPAHLSVLNARAALESPLAIVAQPFRNEVGIDAMSPVSGHEVDVEPEARRHRTPQRREMAGLEHEHAIARRQRVDEGGLPCPGARGGVDKHMAARLENTLHTLEHIAPQPREIATSMVDGRPVDRAEHAVGHVGGTWDLQEMPAASQGHVAALSL